MTINFVQETTVQKCLIKCAFEFVYTQLLAALTSIVLPHIDYFFTLHLDMFRSTQSCLFTIIQLLSVGYNETNKFGKPEQVSL